MKAAVLAVLVCAALPVRAQERQLVDEVVAVVDAHSITLSELAAGEREALRERMGREKYERLLQELLASLRERTTVRILDPLGDAGGTVASKKGG